MGRSPCCDENGLKKGPWTLEEDQKLIHHIQQHGHGSWRALPKLAGRTDNEIKNFWNTHLKKKLIRMGFDPMTHQPRIDPVSTLRYLQALANMTDIMDHNQSMDEHALRLQAEAIQLAKLQYLHFLLQSSNSSSTNNPSIKLPQLENTNNNNPNSFSHEIIAGFGTQPLHHQNNMISDFLDPQVSFSSQSFFNNEQGQGTNYAIISQGGHTTFDHDSTNLVIPTPASSSIFKAGDACSSTSSYGGGISSYNWPELFFEDPIKLHDLS
ncbi:unnamed protein product [Lupinus luteus]|uniref:Uncharacterized protein n=1 Tax=Lupinus luteus TaxID=3873 RepID=A0AAV1Y2M7_LUPLU